MHSGRNLEHDPDHPALLKVPLSGGPASGSPLRVFLTSFAPAVMKIPRDDGNHFFFPPENLIELTVMEQFTPK